MSTDSTMAQNRFVFFDVDTQRDFLEPSGSLYVPKSTDIVPNLARLTEFALGHDIPIVATACAHLADDPELTQLPPHCMAGTPGQERVPATNYPDSVVLGVGERLNGDLPRHLTLLKREFDIFSRPDAGDLVAHKISISRHLWYMVWRPIIASARRLMGSSIEIYAWPSWLTRPEPSIQPSKRIC